MPLEAKLESLLFVSVKAMSAGELAKLTKTKPEQIKEALDNLSQQYQEKKSGLALVKNNSKYQLSTSADNASLVQEFLKDETSGELTQPSLEALTIIAYRGPISKLELERIRGINCSLIIRNLLMRGLIEENYDRKKAEHFYSVSHDFMRFLGIDDLSRLPDYEKLNKLETIDQVLSSDNTEAVE